MSWASKRVTTREEDEAYCLMGILDINMPTPYGEAFRRLQEEIMRQNPDTTLFAWGLRCTLDELVDRRIYLRVEDTDWSSYVPFATSPSTSFTECSVTSSIVPGMFPSLVGHHVWSVISPRYR